MLNTQNRSINRWISILYRYGQSHIGKQVEQFNIGSGQYVFLLALYKKDGISQEEISGHLKIDKATTAKAIKKLEKEGYVKRDINSEDRRAFKVFLTQKAFDIKPEIHKILRNWADVLSEGFSEDEKKSVSELLGRMAKNAFVYFEKKDGKS
ncbi:MAG: MarR family winged helix-turn-helix transcriptional regulator [Candidatus Humimicrobiaceae bacterium]